MLRDKGPISDMSVVCHGKRVISVICFSSVCDEIRVLSGLYGSSVSRDKDPMRVICQ